MKLSICKENVDSNSFQAQLGACLFIFVRIRFDETTLGRFLNLHFTNLPMNICSDTSQNSVHFYMYLYF